VPKLPCVAVCLFISILTAREGCHLIFLLSAFGSDHVVELQIAFSSGVTTILKNMFIDIPRC
jgi:hypothetical protein